MRVAVVSDIHGNLHALDAVLAALEGESIDQLWSLGDVVGYGPQPNACCERIAASADVSLAGNHDLGVLGSLPLDDFSAEAAAAAEWTRDILSDEARSYLEPLSPQAETEGAELYHASPRDPVWEYLLDSGSIRAALDDTAAPIVLVGHSHFALAGVLAGGTFEAGQAPAETDVGLDGRRVLLNPGSVGQPRDGDPRAAYLVLDFGRGVACFRRVEYPLERTQDEIRGRGLPSVFAERLAHGL